MTSLTFADFFTFVYGWIGFWCIVTVILMLTRKGKGWEDYDVIFFWLPLALVAVSVFVNRKFNTATVVISPPMSPYLIFLLVSHSILAYSSMAIPVRIMRVLWSERKHGETREEGVERRHGEMIHAVEKRNIYDNRSKNPID